MERARGPIVIDNYDIPTKQGRFNVDVDCEAFRDYAVNSAGLSENDKQVAINRIDNLVIAFGKRSFKAVLTDLRVEEYLDEGKEPNVALRKAQKEAAGVNFVFRILKMGSPNVAMFYANDKYPMIYLGLPNLLEQNGDKSFYGSWHHELCHFLDYLNSEEKRKLMRHQKKMYIAAGAGSLILPAILTNGYTSPLFPKLENLPLEAAGFALFGVSGFVLGRLGYYFLLHKGERKARKPEKDQSETRELVKLIKIA